MVKSLRSRLCDINLITGIAYPHLHPNSLIHLFLHPDDSDNQFCPYARQRDDWYFHSNNTFDKRVAEIVKRSVIWTLGELAHEWEILFFTDLDRS